MDFSNDTHVLLFLIKKNNMKDGHFSSSNAYNYKSSCVF